MLADIIPLIRYKKGQALELTGQSCVGFRMTFQELSTYDPSITGQINDTNKQFFLCLELRDSDTDISLAEVVNNALLYSFQVNYFRPGASPYLVLLGDSSKIASASAIVQDAFIKQGFRSCRIFSDAGAVENAMFLDSLSEHATHVLSRLYESGDIILWHIFISAETAHDRDPLIGYIRELDQKFFETSPSLYLSLQKNKQLAACVLDEKNENEILRQKLEDLVAVRNLLNEDAKKIIDWHKQEITKIIRWYYQRYDKMPGWYKALGKIIKPLGREQ